MIDLKFVSTSVVVAVAFTVSQPINSQDQKEDQDLDVAFQTVEMEENKKVYTLPEVEEAVPGSYKVGETEFTIERHDENIKFKATTGETESTQWVSDTDKHGRFVYDAEKNQFQRLTNSVRVVMDNYDKLETLIEATEAKGGKAFPDLNFAILNLPKDVHPAAFVKKLEEKDEVKSATVEVERPLQIPL